MFAGFHPEMMRQMQQEQQRRHQNALAPRFPGMMMQMRTGKDQPDQQVPFPSWHPYADRDRGVDLLANPTVPYSDPTIRMPRNALAPEFDPMGWKGRFGR